ncbi:NmrA family NAD(P)-binding protein [Streptomyces atratus]|uniref:NmrA family NAD(P)-binding protein n=1 Tax=Streptomyces atratus TaxID=1893 RepID=UPI00225967B8|nr:NAD(P)H-binding protein [Streptomyces atratus]MCX5339136.1 NAD(P)H-binding protein [Streptomyces atratus]
MIVVTTPTGNLGSQVLAALLRTDEPVRVIARDPSRLAPRVRARVEVVPGSHGDPAVVDRAFHAADTVFWVVPPDPRAKSLDAAFCDFTRPACDALTRHGVQRVVGISALGRGFPGEAGLATASLAMDDLIAGTGVGYRALTMPAFMDNLLASVPTIRSQGAFYSLIDGDRELPTVASRDIAAVVVRLLLDRTWTGQGSVPLLGPQDLSFDDIARIITEVLGRPVRYRRLPTDEFRATMSAAGMSDAMAQGMVDMLLAKNEGLDSAEPRTSRSTTPTDFRNWCEDVLAPAVLAA